MKYPYSECCFTYSVKLKLAVLRVVVPSRPFYVDVDLCGKLSLVGSLAGAAHLLKGNAGVLRWAQREQKSHVDQKGKSRLDFDFQCDYEL